MVAPTAYLVLCPLTWASYAWRVTIVCLVCCRVASPFGIGVDGALGIVAAIKFLGMLLTLLVPETKGETLERWCLNEDDAAKTDNVTDTDTDTDTTAELTRINTADVDLTCISAAADDKLALGSAYKAVVDIELK